jgi:serine/threonine protein kinase/ABC-type branched-subunit amino acid transport system substrate-binding protein
MLNPGDIIAQKYQVVRLIGQGGMSNVYLVRRLGAPANDQQWVIKEMTVSYRDPEDQKRAVDQFLREASLLQKLHHKNLPRVIDQFVLGNRYYFVMEYVEGEDLGKLLTRNPDGLAESLVVKWAIECATVLYYLHAQKPPIVFRDVKPSNIMISKGSVKIIDFGIARNYDAFKKKDTMRIGSPGYAPPEQYSGQTDARSDIYSLGVTLHQLLTGRDPSETQTPFKLPPVRTLNPKISPGMEAIIMRATEMEPARRYKTALDMKRALQELIGVRTGPIGSPTGPVGPMPTGTPAHPPTAATPSGPQPRPIAQALGGPTNVPNLGNAGPPKSGTVPYLTPPGTPGGAPVPGQAAAAGPAGGRAGTPVAGANTVAGGTAAAGAGTVAGGGVPGVPGSSPAVGGPLPGTPGGPPVPFGGSAAGPKSNAAAGGPATPAVAGNAGAPKVAFAAPAPPGPGLLRRALPILLLLLLLGGGATVYFTPHLRQAILENPLVRQAWQRLWGTGGGSTGGSSTTGGGESPVALPSDVPQRALVLEKMGNVDAAMDLLEKQPSTDPLAVIAYNNGLALLGHGHTVNLSVLAPQGEAGAQWLRGVALAQREQNEHGGVADNLLVLQVTDYSWPAGGEPALPAIGDVTDGSTATVLALLPLSGAAAQQLRQALRDRSMPLLETIDTPTDAAVIDAMQKAIGKSIPASHVVVVTMPGVDNDLATRFDASLKAGANAVTAVRLVDATGKASPEEIKTMMGLKPDLIVLLGDALYATRYHAALLEAGYSGGLLSSPVPMPASGGKADSWVVSPYEADSTSVPVEVFGLDFNHTFERTGRPGYWAARGYDTMRAWNDAMAEVSTPSASSAQSALDAAASRKLAGLAGPVLTPGGPTTLYLQHWHAGAWQTATTVTAEAP